MDRLTLKGLQHRTGSPRRSCCGVPSPTPTRYPQGEMARAWPMSFSTSRATNSLPYRPKPWRFARRCLGRSAPEFCQAI